MFIKGDYFIYNLSRLNKTKKPKQQATLPIPTALFNFKDVVNKEKFINQVLVAPVIPELYQLIKVIL